MKKWYVICDLIGTASCHVDAETHDEAIEAAKDNGHWELKDWDCDFSDYSGSIDASEVK